MGLQVQGDRTSHDEKVVRFAAGLYTTGGFVTVTTEDGIQQGGTDYALDIVAARHMPIVPPHTFQSLLERNPGRYFEMTVNGDHIKELHHFEVKSGTARRSLEDAHEQLARGVEHYFPHYDRIYSYVVTPNGPDLVSKLLKPPFDEIHHTEDDIRKALVEHAFYFMQHPFKNVA